MAAIYYRGQIVIKLSVYIIYSTQQLTLRYVFSKKHAHAL